MRATLHALLDAAPPETLRLWYAALEALHLVQALPPPGTAPRPPSEGP